MIFGLFGLLTQSWCDATFDREPDWDTWCGWDSGGCDSDSWAGGSCGAYTGATYIGIQSGSGCPSPTASSALQWGCDPNDGVWWLDVYTVGWAGGADWKLRQTGVDNGWDETHPMAFYESQQDGWWDNLYTELVDVDDPQDVVAGQTSLYECDQARVDTLTQIIVVYDVNGVEADCGVWGEDTSIPEADGCANWN